MTPYQRDRHHLLRHASGRGATWQLNGKRKRHAMTLPTIGGCMTDIVKRLHQIRGDNDDAREAADEIERLRDAYEVAATRLAAAISINRRLTAEVKRLTAEVARLRAEVADRDRIMNMSD